MADVAQIKHHSANYAGLAVKQGRSEAETVMKPLVDKYTDQRINIQSADIQILEQTFGSSDQTNCDSLPL